jgi:integrase
VHGPADVRALCDEDFHALLAHCDRELDRHTRDLAWLTMGITGGLRHISLAHLEIDDVRPIPGGFQAEFRFAKLSSGEVLPKKFLHLGDDPSTCLDPLCPACTLAQQLDVCRRRGQVSGPVLATRYGGQWRAMSRQNGRLRILRAYRTSLPDADPDSKRIATRSLRRTAATWACAAGMSMSQAAAAVTDHKTLAVFAGYVELGEEYEVHPEYRCE